MEPKLFKVVLLVIQINQQLCSTLQQLGDTQIRVSIQPRNIVDLLEMQIIAQSYYKDYKSLIHPSLHQQIMKMVSLDKVIMQHYSFQIITLFTQLLVDINILGLLE